MTDEKKPEKKQDEKQLKKRYRYEKLVLTVVDPLGIKHDFVINADKLGVLQTKFEASGVNFMKFLIENSEPKKKIIMP